MTTTRAPFFTHLPYDIRAIVYAYLKPDKLPPFAPGPPILGFILSCRQAHQEISEIILWPAQERLVACVARFKAKSQIPDWDISTARGNVCDIIVNIPWLQFYNQGGKVTSTVQEDIKRLHPLLALYFNMVRIHVIRTEDGWLPPHSTLRERGRIDENMHVLMRDVVARMIDRQRDVSGVSLESSDDVSEVPPDSRVKTRRICLSWDLRSEVDAMQDPTLYGELHHSRNIGRESYDGCRLLHGVGAEELQQARHLDPRCYPRAVFYHLRDSQRLVGQMCLQSHPRWVICEEGFFLNEALNGQETDREYVSSRGLGSCIKRGLDVVSEEEYEKQEREIEAVVWP